jgi:hypothetical protein
MDHTWLWVQDAMGAQNDVTEGAAPNSYETIEGPVAGGALRQALDRG